MNFYGEIFVNKIAQICTGSKKCTEKWKAAKQLLKDC